MKNGKKSSVCNKILQTLHKTLFLNLVTLFFYFNVTQFHHFLIFVQDHILNGFSCF